MANGMRTKETPLLDVVESTTLLFFVMRFRGEKISLSDLQYGDSCFFSIRHNHDNWKNYMERYDQNTKEAHVLIVLESIKHAITYRKEIGIDQFVALVWSNNTILAFNDIVKQAKKNPSLMEFVHKVFWKFDELTDLYRAAFGSSLNRDLLETFDTVGDFELAYCY